MNAMPSLHAAIKTPLRTGLESVPLVFWQRLFPKDVICMVYHVVSDQNLPHMKYYPYKTVRRFESDVTYIREHHRFLEYDELVRRRRRGDTGASNAFLLTFDDGFVECFDIVRPILLSHGAGGAFFISSDFIDNRAVFIELAVSLCLDAIERLNAEYASAIAVELGLCIEQSGKQASSPTERVSELDAHHVLRRCLLTRGSRDAAFVAAVCERLSIDPSVYVRQRSPYMTAAHLRELVASGFTVGAHGIAHRDLATMSPAQIEHEIVQSCDTIRQLTGQRRVPFAFPYAGDAIDRTALADILRRYEFIELFFDSGGLRAAHTCVVDRVWGDPPTGCVGDETNLPRLLRRAWSQRSAWTRQLFSVHALANDDRSNAGEPASGAARSGGDEFANRASEPRRERRAAPVHGKVEDRGL